ESLQILPRAHFEMPRDKGLGRSRKQLLENLNPVQNAAAVHCRRTAIQEEVTRRDDSLFRKLHHKITHRVSGPAKLDVNRMTVNVDISFISGYGCNPVGDGLQRNECFAGKMLF